MKKEKNVQPTSESGNSKKPIVSRSANDLQLDQKRANAVGHLCEKLASGEYTLREILFAMCFLAEAGYE